MSKFTDALAAYLRKHGHFPARSPKGDKQTTFIYTDLGVRHEEGWSNDSGTSWPASVYITYTRESFRNGKKTGSLKSEFYVDTDIVDFMRALIEGD